ncbi:MAG: hypothetical protein Q9211_000087 [Gyalolechia sp. 1 TL-2023]
MAPPPQVNIAEFRKPVGQFLSVQSGISGGRYFGPTCLEFLMHDMDTLVIQPLQDSWLENKTMGEVVPLAHHKIECLLGRDDELIQDGSAPTSPPYSVLEPMIEPYFAAINPYFPVWSKENFVRLALASQYSEGPDEDHAFIICSNNLILMTLAANSLRSRLARQIQSTHRSRSSSVDSDLTRTFLTNAKRAIKNIELLLSPRLINVQALLSLWDHAQDQVSEDDILERQNVSYCLYILDKAVCWTTGRSPSISKFDVHITSDVKRNGDRAAVQLVARARLAEIEETIYSDIYSYKPRAESGEQAQAAVSKIDLQLQQWLLESGINIVDVQDTGAQVPPTNLELSIAFYSLRLLLVSSFQDRGLERVELARKYIKLLLQLRQSALELGQYPVLSRLLASHPALYLKELFAHVVSGRGDDSDLQLLQSFVDMLQTITESREEMAHNTRLHDFSLVLLSVVNATQSQVRNRQKGPQPSLTSSKCSVSTLPTPGSGTSLHHHSSGDGRHDNGNRSNRTSLFQEAHAHELAKLTSELVVPGMVDDDPFTFPEPAGLGFPGVAANNDCSTDELVAFMEGLERGSPFDGTGFLSSTAESR